MSTEIEVQGIVHKLEEGSWKKWVLIAVMAAGTIGVVSLWFFGKEHGFKGLSHPHAFEQAEIARELARGHGFSTKMIRPAAIWLFEQNTGTFNLERNPDIYHAPLWPLVLTPFVWLARDSWEMSLRNQVYTLDKVVAAVSTLFFVLSVLVSFFVARRLFDQRLAFFIVGFMLVCDRLWEFSISGLPQMLLLFLFSIAVYTLLRAVEAHCALHQSDAPYDEAQEGSEWGEEDASGTRAGLSRLALMKTPLPWLVLTAVMFGLLALAHALTIWIFGGVLVFCAFLFRPRWRSVGIMAAVFLLVYSPWLVRNYCVCGGFSGIGGLAWYSGLYQVRGSESSIMRSMEPPMGGVGMKAFPVKASRQISEQLGSIYKYLGHNIVAPFFFISLLHIFKRREIAIFRWAVLLMWLGAMLGMGFFGLDDQRLPSNDLHILFLPLFGLYGLAFVLNLWSRLEISHIWLVKIGFLTFLYLVSGRSFLGTMIELLGPPQNLVQWPPYYAQSIPYLRNWTNENEIVMSDMPWAVAWYADRESLWLPMTIQNFIELNDYKRLKNPIVGLYLTPVSGDRAFLSEIENGEYEKWAPFITRTVVLKNFPFRAKLPMPLNQECFVYFDRDRWTPRED